jgi:hypothetical protein
LLERKISHFIPVTLDDENGCSMLDSAGGLWHGLVEAVEVRDDARA